jgi:hypothetical protein
MALLKPRLLKSRFIKNVDIQFSVHSEFLESSSGTFSQKIGKPNNLNVFESKKTA